MRIDRMNVQTWHLDEEQLCSYIFGLLHRSNVIIATDNTPNRELRRMQTSLLDESCMIKFYIVPWIKRKTWGNMVFLHHIHNHFKEAFTIVSITKWHDVTQPSIWITLNLCSAFHPSKVHTSHPRCLWAHTQSSRQPAFGALVPPQS